MSKEITIKESDLQYALILAFENGENWGVTYGGWFNPTMENKAEKAAKSCNKIYSELKEKAIK